MAVPSGAPQELISEVESLRNALRNLLQVVIKIYINSWYTLISPRDRDFISAVRSTSLAYLNSIIDHLTLTQQDRDEAQKRLLELLFTTAPTILQRHAKAYRLAQDDSATMCRGIAAGGNDTSERNEAVNSHPQSPAQDPMLLLSQRYQLYAPHPGMESAQGMVDDNRKVPPPTTGPNDVERPRTPQGIDESLADALSSSITNLPPQHPPDTQREPMLNNGYDSAGQSIALDPQSQPVYAPSPRYLSLLIDRTLEMHLPREDYASVAERTMITEVMANAVLGNVLRKCSEPWFIWRIGLSLLGVEGSLDDAEETNSATGNGSAVTGQTTSGSTTDSTGIPNTVFSSTSSYLNLLSHIPGMLVAAYVYLSAAISNYLSGSLQANSKTIDPGQQPPLQSYLLEPWIEASIPLVSATSTFGTQEVWAIVKMLYIAISNRVDTFARQLAMDSLHVDAATNLVSKLTDTLFPGGQLAPSIPDPSQEEAQAMRQELERCVYNRIPLPARFLLLGVSEVAQRNAIANALDVFSDASANANFLLTLTETALLALVPQVSGTNSQ